MHQSIREAMTPAQADVAQTGHDSLTGEVGQQIAQ